MIHDLLITGGAVATMDDAFPRADWVAISHGLISAVGVGDAPDGRRLSVVTNSLKGNRKGSP
jgi:predicted amidohydrolase YtcJ